MAREDVDVVEKFKAIVINHLENVLIALPAIVPQSKEDMDLFKRGMNDISTLIHNLKECESIRELSKYIDTQKVVEDFDEESIRNLNYKITQSAKASVRRLEDMIETMRYGDGEDD